MPKARKEQKAEQVELLTEKLKKAKVAVLTDYRGLTVKQMQDLRGKLRTGNVEYRVVKNTLARRAADAAGYKDLESELKGPVAIAFGYDDLSLPPRLINEFVRTTRLKVEVVGGVRDPDGTTLELRKTLTTGGSKTFGTARLVKEQGVWKLAEDNWH